jgi:hypothetical protein
VFDGPLRLQQDQGVGRARIHDATIAATITKHCISLPSFRGVRAVTRGARKLRELGRNARERSF